MKHFALFFAILMSVAMAAQHGTINIQTNLDSTINYQYAIDTLESYQVGPGIIYTRFDITTNKANANNIHHFGCSNNLWVG